ncbi:MAG TPA: hypothetical protein DCE41_21530 [Cytophagales bacterium]|nr:hypothetical protein [Cytophagales bacterium]HAA18334.1 hypothetical protein [Cytophagales bacterium]HAP59576.1 hypothetical protein [Cytophagales bacterium]
MKSRARKVLRISGYIFLTLIIAAVAGCAALDRPIPEGVEGPKAEELAEKISQYVKLDAWEATPVVQFNFMGVHQYVWDKHRSLAQVTWKDTKVLMDLQTQDGKVWKEGKLVTGEEASEALTSAWEFYCNDTFWFNPLVKLYEEGVTRKYVPLEGPQDGLLVTYNTGGVTPGDSYLWYVNEDGQPTDWRMWVQVLPLGGIQVPWDGWTTLHTGARVSTEHKSGLMGMTLDNVKSADSVEELLGEDIFEPLFNVM